MTAHTDDIEPVAIDDTPRRRAVDGRYGDHAPAALPNSIRPDPLKAVTRKLATRRVRHAGRVLCRLMARKLWRRVVREAGR